MKLKRTALYTAIGISALALGGCQTANVRVNELENEVQAKDMALLKQQQENIQLQKTLEQQQQNSAAQSNPVQVASTVSDLLPPDAQSGECYARVWVEPTYRELTESKLVREASEEVSIIPARYEMGEEVVLISEASSRLETIPATYRTEKETIMTKEAEQVWRVDLPSTSPPASKELLSSARAGNIDLDSATPGMCFHEHYLPAKYTTEQQEVLVNQATNKVGVTAAKYRTVEKTVLVKEASFRMEEVPAQYRWEEEQVIDKPAHTVWKKGTGPIQKMDAATGEIMCLVDIPATFKTVRKKVLASPATSRKIEIPAEYKTVSVRELAEKAGESNTEIPAVYDSINVTKKVSDAQFVWHEVHNLDHPTETRTGLKVCLTESPAQFKTITRQVVASPASTRSVEIPAVHKTIKVRKLAEEAKEVRTPIPEEYKTFTHQELEKEGFMEWRSILCETNMTSGRITAIQRALDEAGFNPGAIDGVIGAGTINAANEFQRSKGLPVDRYLNLTTLKALGVSPR